MLTHVAPIIIYIISYPVMIASLMRVEIGILFLVTFVPIISLMMKIVELPNGNNCVDLLIACMIFCTMIKIGREEKATVRGGAINAVVILFVFGSIINLAQGFMYASFSSETNLIRLQAWKNYMLLPIIYFISAYNVKTEDLVKKILGCFCITMIAMDFNFYSTFKWLNGDHYSDTLRISGPLGYLGPNELGIFYSMYSFLLIGIAYFVEDKRLKYMILLTCACNLYPILFSYSRTAYMCTFIGLVVIGIMQDRRILLIVVMLLTFYRVILPNSVVERIDLAFLQQGEISQTKEQSSALDVGGVQLDTVGRKELWDKALNYFKEQPLLGIGFDTFRQSEGMITHNMFYRILAEEGLVGMAIFIVFVVTLLRKALRLFRKSPSSLGKGIGLGVFSCIVVHLTGSAAGDTYVFFNMMCVYWLFIGIMASFNNLIDVGQDQGSPTALEQSS